MNVPECRVTPYAFPAYRPVMPRRGRRSSPSKITRFPNRIAALREARGWSNREALVAASGLSYEVIAKLERGETRLKVDQVRRLADALGVEDTALTAEIDAPDRRVPVVGYVGAGTEVFPFDDFPAGSGLRRVRCPDGLDPLRTVAVQVRGDSMFPLSEGSILFYRKVAEGVPFEAVGQMCIVKLAGDGPMLVKHLRRGYTRGRYNLLSNNAAPREDAEIEWAAPVLVVMQGDAIG
jgi:transcriptional regulator with XRE-family HTH domain